MEKKKCVIPKAPLSDQGNSRYVRVSSDVYDCISEIARKTGRSLADVTSRLCRYALEDVQIAEFENA